MPDVHVMQWTAAFLVAMWLTIGLFRNLPEQRWRHLIQGIAAIPLWIAVAYLADNVGVASEGQAVAFGSTALAFVSIFMIVVTILGVALGLLYWVESGVRETRDSMPENVPRR